MAKKQIFVDGFEVGIEALVKAYKTVMLSLGQQLNRVREAWYSEFDNPSSVPGDGQPDCWVKDVYEDRVIVEVDGVLYAYSHASGDDGAVEFGEPVRVVIVYQEVGVEKSQAVKALAVKMLSETEEEWVVGGYGMIWGDETQRDLTPWANRDGSKGEFFTPATQGLDDIPIKAMTFEHDQDVDEQGLPIKDVVGVTLLERNDARGRWVEARVEKNRQYAQYVVDLMAKGELYLSSETAGHWREVAGNGEIKRWRTAGYTFTESPMEPRIGAMAQMQAAYKSAGLDLPPLGDGGDDAGASCQDAEVGKALAQVAIDLRLSEIEEQLEG